MTSSPETHQHQRKPEMFEFAAGQVQQEERERQIAEGLRRRELLAASAADEVQVVEERRSANMHARPRTPARAHAER